MIDLTLFNVDLEHITMITKTVQVKMVKIIKNSTMVVCSKLLRAQVGWSFIQHSTSPPALELHHTYALSYTSYSSVSVIRFFN